MEFSFNKKKLRKDIILEICTIVPYILAAYLFSCSNDVYELFKSPLFLCLLGIFIGYSSIYPIIVMFNYRRFNKDSGLSIDDKKIVYRDRGKEDIIYIKEIETILQIKGYVIVVLPYYYKISLKDGRKYYISNLLIANMEGYVDKTVYWTRKLNLFMPEDEDLKTNYLRN